MKNEHLWSIILAGGDGQRTRRFIERWLGSYKPKQYCRFVGTRSFFPMHAIKRFLEKPQPHDAGAAMDAGGLWNTFILVAKAAVLWRLGGCLLPDLMLHFERIRRAIGTTSELQVIDEAYRTMPIWDFSTHVLQRVPRELAVMELRGICWNDWGRPERIADTLQGIGKQPLFPLEILRAS